MTVAHSSYGQFSLALHNHFGAERVPLEVSLEVSRRCPLECKHCYNNLPMGDLKARARELTKDEYFSILDELAEMGVFWLLFTGGEIFARNDFLDIYTHAKEKGFLITLFTNGVLINEKIVSHLREYPPFAIEITLYGSTQETYEALTGMRGGYERCMRGIRLLLDAKLPLKLKTVATRLNRHEVRAMKALAENQLGVEFKFDSLINPRIDCSHAPLEVRLSAEEAVALDLYWPQRAEANRQILEQELQRPLGTRNTVYSCGGGLKSFAIDPYGQMSICVISHQETYDVRSGSVRQGWEHFLHNIRRRERTQLTKCVSCRIRSMCSMCPAMGELENGDPESPVEFFCEVAHLRAIAMGFEVPPHGHCEFCRDQRKRGELEQTARRIRVRETDPGTWMSTPPLLPVLNNSAAAPCGGCGALH